MAKKVMAGFLLVVIAAWAEMAMAPMFAMHAGYKHLAHEMAAAAAHHHSSHGRAVHGQAPAEGRPCCPRMHEAEAISELELVSGSGGCDDPHSCCFRQGPQSVPAPARDGKGLSRETGPVVLAESRPASVAAGRPVRDCSLTSSPPTDTLGMILRV